MDRLRSEINAGKVRQRRRWSGGRRCKWGLWHRRPSGILFYFASPAGNIVGRATLVAYFLLTDAIGLMFLARENLVTIDSLFRTLIFLPALFAGVWLGARSFRNADPAVFRKWVLAILAVLAIITAAKGIYALQP